MVPGEREGRGVIRYHRRYGLAPHADEADVSGLRDDLTLPDPLLVA
jgi:hypothetical protein